MFNFLNHFKVGLVVGLIGLQCFMPLPAHAQTDLILPQPALVTLSQPVNPSLLKGIKVFADKPFKFDFVLDSSVGRQPAGAGPHWGMPPAGIASLGGPRTDAQSGESMKQEVNRLVKYFLAGLTIPEGDLWVNLSPYEANRIVPESFGLTGMGRDVLAEDYVLKQLTANMMHPDSEIGREFWKRIYEEAKKQGISQIPVNALNKVWILPAQAEVYEGCGSNKNGFNTKNSVGRSPKEHSDEGDYHNVACAYITKATLKVMLEEDYIAASQSQPGDIAKLCTLMPGISKGHPQAGCQARSVLNVRATEGVNVSTIKIKQIISSLILPVIEKEVNEGANFATLRQVYHSLILATWYKAKIKKSLIAKQYVNQKKVQGLGGQTSKELNGKVPQGNNVTPNDNEIEYIYQEYIKSFKKGAYNLIREEPDPITGNAVSRKYFAGGLQLNVKLDYAMQAPQEPVNAQLAHVDMTQGNVIRTQNLQDSSLLNKQQAGLSGEDSAMVTYLVFNRMMKQLNGQRFGDLKLIRQGFQFGDKVIQFKIINDKGIYVGRVFFTRKVLSPNTIWIPSIYIHEEHLAQRRAGFLRALVRKLSEIMPINSKLGLEEVVNSKTLEVLLRGIIAQHSIVPVFFDQLKMPALNNIINEWEINKDGQVYQLLSDEQLLSVFKRYKQFVNDNPEKKLPTLEMISQEGGFGAVLVQSGFSRDLSIEVYDDRIDMIATNTRRDRAMTTEPDMFDHLITMSFTLSRRLDEAGKWLLQQHYVPIKDGKFKLVDVGSATGEALSSVAQMIYEVNPAIEVVGLEPNEETFLLMTKVMPRNVKMFNKNHRYIKDLNGELPIKIMTIFNLAFYFRRNQKAFILEATEKLAEGGIVLIGSGGREVDLYFIVLRKENGKLRVIEAVAPLKSTGDLFRLMFELESVSVDPDDFRHIQANYIDKIPMLLATADLTVPELFNELKFKYEILPSGYYRLKMDLEEFHGGSEDLEKPTKGSSDKALSVHLNEIINVGYGYINVNGTHLAAIVRKSQGDVLIDLYDNANNLTKRVGYLLVGFKDFGSGNTAYLDTALRINNISFDSLTQDQIRFLRELNINAQQIDINAYQKLFGLWVEEPYRHDGELYYKNMGSLLIKFAIEIAQARGVSSLIIKTLPSIYPFYQKLGAQFNTDTQTKTDYKLKFQIERARLGGVDFNPIANQLNIRKQADQFPVKELGREQDQLSLLNIDGLTPVIRDIQPLPSLFAFLNN